ncbi:MAG: type II secretion system protein [Bdellovibrionota bacterium]|nr:type II secretion system protein [Bdellovibrionota bacterium]
MRTSESGFSLVELIVSVSILGILSAISVPNIVAYSRRAKQKEGIAMLSALYGNMRTSRAQLEFFPGDFVAAGYRPEGLINYHIYLQDAGGFQPLYPSNWYCNQACYSTDNVSCDIYRTGSCDGSGTSLGEHVSWTAGPTAVTYTGALGAICDPAVTNTFFRGCAYADLGGNQLSVIEIDNGKNLLILQDGTNGN